MNKMAEKETVFTGKIKYSGVFSFKDFYKFCYEWLTEEIGLKITENKYSEKLTGESKNIEVRWNGKKDITDYFQMESELIFFIWGLKNVEVTQGGKKIETNQGIVELRLSSNLIRDYKGKFEMNALNKFLRSIYEKWVIVSRIEEFENKIAEESDEFLGQGKAYLDLEGKK